MCDFTDKLRKQAKIRNFRRTADEERFYFFHTEYDAFIEIMSFDAMMDLAERRNRILFEKLGLKQIPLTPDPPDANGSACLHVDETAQREPA